MASPPDPQIRDRRRYTLRDFWQDFVPAIAVGLAAYAVISFVDQRDVDRELREVDVELRAIEQRDRDANRATAFRLCTRNKIDRAFAHSFSLDEPDELRRLQAEEGLPILNCDPNLRGQGATPLSPEDQREFVERWMAGALRPVELGICPQSHIGQRQRPDRC